MPNSSSRDYSKLNDIVSTTEPPSWPSLQHLPDEILLQIFSHLDADSVRNMMSIDDQRFHRVGIDQCRRVLVQLNRSFDTWLKPAIGRLNSDVWRKCKRSRHHDLLFTFLPAKLLYCTKPETLTDFTVVWPLVRTFGRPDGRETVHYLSQQIDILMRQPCDEQRLNDYRDAAIDLLNFVFVMCVPTSPTDRTMPLRWCLYRERNYCPKLDIVTLDWDRMPCWGTEISWCARRLRHFGHPVAMQAVDEADEDEEMLADVYKHHSMLAAMLEESVCMEFRCLNVNLLVEQILPRFKRLMFLFVTNVSAGDLMVLLQYINRRNTIHYFGVYGTELSDPAYRQEPARSCDVLDTKKLERIECLRAMSFECCPYLTTHFCKSLLRNAPNMILMDLFNVHELSRSGMDEIEVLVDQQRERLKSAREPSSIVVRVDRLPKLPRCFYISTVAFIVMALVACSGVMNVFGIDTSELG